ncbi:MAG TPA: phage holin family protein [Anaerolineae bacterium]|nr:phage holin family protein [Anaerolineae bacterium]HXW00068.1 phage holin family protein [Anaerolineae bacterium]
MKSEWISAWKKGHKHQLNWKLALLRIGINGLAIAVIAVLLPGVMVPQPSLRNLLILGVSAGILNAVVKPVVSFLTLPFIFATFGLVVVIINMIMFLILEFIFPNILIIESIWAALLGGLLLGLVGTFLESLLGLTPPIVDDAPQIKGAGSAKLIRGGENAAN